MSKKTIKDEQVDIEVTRVFPTNTVKTVLIKLNKESFRNTISLSKADAEYVYVALRDVLGYKEYTKPVDVEGNSNDQSS